MDWSPGAGNGQSFRMLGRIGERRGTVKLTDFREQRGIYVLYDDYGPYYVGLARDQDIGSRLRAHTRNRHKDNWDRFSWFGFRRVLGGTYEDGTQRLGKVPERLLTESRWTIGDIEALMIQALGTQHKGNRMTMRFAAADQWHQVMDHEVVKYLERI